MAQTVNRRRVTSVSKKIETLSVDSILIDNNFVSVQRGTNKKLAVSSIGTILNNLSYFGYVPSEAVFSALLLLDDVQLISWWTKTESILSEITGDNRKMDEYVVYKNFPGEILEMSEAEYWFNQILMYWGLPNEWFTTPAQPRNPLLEKSKLKVLHLAKEDTLRFIYDNLLASSTKLNSKQLDQVKYLIDFNSFDVNVSNIPFKENLIILLSHAMQSGIVVSVRSATDVMRLAIVLSGGELNSTTDIKFRKFSKSERRFFLNLLNNSTQLEEDVARNPEKWKRFFYLLHPNDYKKTYSNVVRINNKLYNNKVRSFASEVIELMSKDDILGLFLASSRPGDFMRRLNHLGIKYNDEVVPVYKDVVKELTLIQLLKMKKYLSTYFTRLDRIFTPKSNWNKVQIKPNDGKKMSKSLVAKLKDTTENAITKKVNAAFPEGVSFAMDIDNIKFSNSDNAAYGRGTSFPIPDNVNFIRTASYWENKGYGNNWFDNGWNFFDENWKGLGTLCWNTTSFPGAIFSGDPTNSKTKDGKACQLIDLYLNKLEKAGVRYAVWNILCFSSIKFSQATDVFAALQWGNDANSGKLFEPSRAQIAFPLKDDVLAKFIAYIDIKERKLVFLDLNLKAKVNSAASNLKALEKTMPAVVQYIDLIPSVFDMFENANEGSTPILYSDKNTELTNDEKAYVFKPENENNSFTQISLNEIIKK